MNLPPSRNIAQSSYDRSASGAARKTGAAKWLIGGALLILMLGAFWYFNNSGNGSADRQPRPVAPAPVRVAEVVRRDMKVVRYTPGTVIANTTVQITARVQGVLDAASFKEGQLVKKGDLLFQIDPRPFQAALEQARAVLLRDQAQLKNANRDKQLYENLNKLGAVSTQQRDTA